ncbi:DUF2848 domain-containing protein [Herbaspirillum sp. GCM10030257]|uniref:DUF2848 domain-containing protein n=1 Tax=Herbaspirillum sp. GCM10030257 TaxID=3273393 RepID=UPI0036208C5D
MNTYIEQEDEQTSTLKFCINEERRVVTVKDLVIAGWAGRDPAAIEHHIQELAALGVARPRNIPSFYRLSASLLTTDRQLDFVGNDSSGEVECVLVSLSDGMYVGVGSDHTDRKVEAYGVTVSKQMCAKPVGRNLWKLDALLDHWDRLVLRSWVTRNGERTLYQEGSVTGLLHPQDLMRRFDQQDRLQPGTVMFCGTLPVKGQIGGGELFEIELEDPVLNRRLKHQYSARALAYAD